VSGYQVSGTGKSLLLTPSTWTPEVVWQKLPLKEKSFRKKEKKNVPVGIAHVAALSTIR